MSSWQEILLDPAKTVLAQIGQFLANTLLVIIILIIGWIIAKIIKTIVTKVLRVIDGYSDRIGLDGILAKGGITYSFSELIGAISYWSVLLITIAIAVSAMGLTAAADLLNKIIFYVPNVITAIFIVILGLFMATLLRNIVQTATANAGLSQSKLLSKTVEVIVIVFAVILALEQLNIGFRVTELMLSIILGSLGLGCALAFGLGCKDIAGRAVSDLIEKLKKK